MSRSDGAAVTLVVVIDITGRAVRWYSPVHRRHADNQPIANGWPRRSLTRDEVALALSLRKTVIPLAASGGATAEAHRLLGGRPDRGLLTADELTDLGTITEAEHAAALVERILRRKADTTP